MIELHPTKLFALSTMLKCSEQANLKNVVHQFFPVIPKRKTVVSLMKTSSYMWKFLQEELTELEIQIFRKWLHSSEYHWNEFKLVKMIWEVVTGLDKISIIYPKDYWKQIKRRI